MMAEVALLDGRPPSMAVGTSNLALSNLTFEGRDRGFAVGELDHAVSLHADVVEIEHHDVGFAAVHAGGRLEVVSDEEQVATAKWPGISIGAPVWINSPRARTTPGSSPVAIGAYEFAVGNFCDQSF